MSSYITDVLDCLTTGLDREIVFFINRTTLDHFLSTLPNMVHCTNISQDNVSVFLHDEISSGFSTSTRFRAGYISHRPDSL